MIYEGANVCYAAARVEAFAKESREQSKPGAAGRRGADKHFAAAAFADAYAPR